MTRDTIPQHLRDSTLQAIHDIRQGAADPQLAADDTIEQIADNLYPAAIVPNIDWDQPDTTTTVNSNNLVTVTRTWTPTDGQLLNYQPSRQPIGQPPIHMRINAQEASFTLTDATADSLDKTTQRFRTHITSIINNIAKDLAEHQQHHRQQLTNELQTRRTALNTAAQLDAQPGGEDLPQ